MRRAVRIHIPLSRTVAGALAVALAGCAAPGRDLILCDVNPARDPDYMKKTSGRMEVGRWTQFPHRARCRAALQSRAGPPGPAPGAVASCTKTTDVDDSIRGKAHPGFLPVSEKQLTYLYNELYF
jgi:hypothetical protein